MRGVQHAECQGMLAKKGRETAAFAESLGKKGAHSGEQGWLFELSQRLGWLRKGSVTAKIDLDAKRKRALLGRYAAWTRTRRDRWSWNDQASFPPLAFGSIACPIR